MKKFLLFLAVAGMTTFTSCSDDDSAPGVTAITLTASATQVDLGAEVTLSVMSNLDTDVTATSTFTANGTAITGSTFSSLTAGTYNIVATYNGIASNAVTVTVLPAIYALHNGVTITPNRNALIYYGSGDVLEDGVIRSYWTYLTYTGTSINDLATSTFVSEVDFLTTVVNNQIVLPNAGANLFYELFSLKVNNADVTINTSAGTVVTNSLESTANPGAVSFVADLTYNGNQTLKVNYTGVNEIFDASGRPAAKGDMAIEMVSMEEIKARKAAFTIKK